MQRTSTDSPSSNQPTITALNTLADQDAEKITWLAKIDAWDKRVVQWFNAKMHDVKLRWKLQVVSQIFSPWLLLAVGLIFLFVALYTDEFLNLASYCGSVEQGFAVFFVIKYIVRRPRPYIENGKIMRLDRMTSKSGFPSGHAFAVMLIGSFLLIHYQIPSWAFSIVVAFATITSLTRLYLGVHYPTDVIFGGLIGFMSNLVYFGFTSSHIISWYYSWF